MFATRRSSIAILIAAGLITIAANTSPAEAALNVGDIVNKSPLSTEKDKSLLFGGCDGDPYAILEKYKGGRDVLLRPTQSGNTLRDGIDPALACRLVKMLQFADQKGCRTRITSGYRSPAKQAAMCGGGRTGCARAGTSCHQYGLAVDMNGPCLSWLKQIAPQFQLIQNQIPGDPYHFQCAEHRGASRRSCTGPCNGGVAITPDFSNMPAPYTDSRNLPSSGLTDAARNLLNPPPQPPPTPSQPIAQSQQPQLQQQPELGAENKTAYAPGTCPPQFYCRNDTYYYRASTCVDQVQKKCSAGCSKTGSTCAATSTSEMSAFEKIETIAGPEAEEVGTVSDQLLELAISGEEIATLKDTSTTTNAQNIPYVPPPPLSEQTFVSPDLRYAPADQRVSQEMSVMQRTLAAMKETLLRALSYLRPFGYSAAITEEAELIE